MALLRRPAHLDATRWATTLADALSRAARAPRVARQVLDIPLRSDDPHAVGATADYDAICETWLEADAERLAVAPFAQAAPEVAALVDLKRSTSMVVREVVVREPRPSPYKIISFIWRGPTLPGDRFYTYWQETHAPLLKTVPEFWRHIQGYVQNHPVIAARGLGGGAPDRFDGVTQLWFESDAAAVRAFSEPRYLEVIRADETILRSGAPHRLAAREHPTFSR